MQGFVSVKAYASRVRGEPKMPDFRRKGAPIGWNAGDYDMLENGVIIGRISKVPIRAATPRVILCLNFEPTMM